MPSPPQRLASVGGETGAPCACGFPAQHRGRRGDMKTATLLAVCTLFAALPACAADPDPVSAGLQAETNARLFKPVPGKAVIYVLRDRGDIWTLDVPVQLDGKA